MDALVKLQDRKSLILFSQVPHKLHKQNTRSPPIVQYQRKFNIFPPRPLDLAIHLQCDGTRLVVNSMINHRKNKEKIQLFDCDFRGRKWLSHVLFSSSIVV